MYLNRSADGEPQQFEFGLAEMAMFGAEHGPLDRAKLNVYFADRRVAKDLSCRVFAPGSWGHAPPGTSDLTMHGGAIRCSAWEFLSVDPPEPT